MEVNVSVRVGGILSKVKITYIPQFNLTGLIMLGRMKYILLSHWYFNAAI
jgi:hypothetical protein